MAVWYVFGVVQIYSGPAVVAVAEVAAGLGAVPPQFAALVQAESDMSGSIGS